MSIDLAVIHGMLNTLVSVVEAKAERAMDCSARDIAPDGRNFEFVGFATTLTGPQIISGTEIDVLAVELQNELLKRLEGVKVLYWKLKPEIIIGPDRVKIGCRVRIAETIATRLSKAHAAFDSAQQPPVLNG